MTSSIVDIGRRSGVSDIDGVGARASGWPDGRRYRGVQCRHGDTNAGRVRRYRSQGMPRYWCAVPARDGAMSGSGTRAAWRAMNPVSAAVRRGGDERVHGAPGADGIVVAGGEASRYTQDGRMPYVDTVSVRLAGLPIEVFSLVDFSGDFA